MSNTNWGEVMNINIGDFVGVPCQIETGPFPDEHVITITTDDESMSGFASAENIHRTSEKSGFVKAQIVQVKENYILVRIFASFFTTAGGHTTLNAHWAKDNLERMAAA
ncbi:MAG: hypothetical protein ACREHG_00010 [Candidatus Saccharimonadales bacterium]